MKFPFNIKEKITETAEHIHAVAKKDLTVILDKKGVNIQYPRATKQTIKWRAKNH